MSGLVLLLA